MLPEVSSEICTHCGDFVPLSERKADPNEGSFCCSGCRTVHQILTSRGLDDYYLLRQRFDTRKLFPTQEQESEYAYLDDPHFLQAEGINQSNSMVFYLEGIHCVACLWLIEKLPKLVPGIIQARVNMAERTVELKREPEGSFAAAARMLQAIGYKPHPLHDETDYEKHFRDENRLWLMRVGIAGALTGNIMLLAISIYGGADSFWKDHFHLLSAVLSLPVLTYCAWPFYRSAIGAMRVGKVSIDVPIVLAIILGGLASLASMIRGSDAIYFDSLATLIFLILSSRYVLRRIHEKALSAQRFMKILTPPSAQKIRPDTLEIESVASSSLKLGDIIIIASGEVSPTDGTLLSQNGMIDASLFSGESEPLMRRQGDAIFGGYKNVGDPIRMKVSQSPQTSRLGKIISEISKPRDAASTALTVTDKVARYFVLATLGVGLAILVYFASSDFDEGFQRALAFIIVVCPCGLALAVPLSFALFMAQGMKSGIVIKSAQVLERLAKVKGIFFDKTGTLTTGKMKLSDLWIDPNEDAQKIEEIIFWLEKDSRHPIGKLLSKAMLQRNPQFDSIHPCPLVEVREVLGTGPEAIINGKTFAIRSLSAVDQFDNKPKEILRGRVGLWCDDRLIAVASFQDYLKDGAHTVVTSLQSMGFKPSILSGDRKENVDQIGTTLAIPPECRHFEKSPEQKNDLINASPLTAMVGDGANDALSLKASYVGIAVHGSLEVSFDASDVMITNENLISLVNTFQLAKKCRSVINRNLMISICYNVGGGALAVLGFINPLAAAIFMPLSSLTVLASTFWGASKPIQTPVG
jgi:Cu2+-exporting ATPase/Cu+-exporting ATPase